jgi:hypothetical protein
MAQNARTEQNRTEAASLSIRAERLNRKEAASMCRMAQNARTEQNISSFSCDWLRTPEQNRKKQNRAGSLYPMTSNA